MIIKNLSHGDFRDAKTNIKLRRALEKPSNLSDKQLIALYPTYVQKLGGDTCGLITSTGLSMIHPAFLLSTGINVGFTIRHLNQIRKLNKEVKLRGLKLKHDWLQLAPRFATGAAVRIFILVISFGTLDLVVGSQVLSSLLPNDIDSAFPDASSTIMTAHPDLLAYTNLDDVQNILGAAASYTQEHVAGNDLPIVWDHTQEFIGPGYSQSLTQVVENQAGLGNYSFLTEQTKILLELNVGQAVTEQIYKTVLEDPANKILLVRAGACSFEEKSKIL